MVETVQGIVAPDVVRPGAEIIPFRKTASRLRCLQALKRSHRGGYLVDIGERYIVMSTQPKSGSFIEVDSAGRCRDVVRS